MTSGGMRLVLSWPVAGRGSSRFRKSGSVPVALMSRSSSRIGAVALLQSMYWLFQAPVEKMPGS